MTKTVADHVNFAAAAPEIERYFPADDRLVEGRPEQTVQVMFTSPDGAFVTGFWTGDVGAHRVIYSEEEYCEMIAGEVEVTDLSGATVTYRPGDRFVIPAGFEGVWRTVKPSKKVFVIYEKA